MRDLKTKNITAKKITLEIIKSENIFATNIKANKIFAKKILTTKIQVKNNITCQDLQAETIIAPTITITDTLFATKSLTFSKIIKEKPNTIIHSPPENTLQLSENSVKFEQFLRPQISEKLIKKPIINFHKSFFKKKINLRLMKILCKIKEKTHQDLQPSNQQPVSDETVKEIDKEIILSQLLKKKFEWVYRKNYDKLIIFVKNTTSYCTLELKGIDLYFDFNGSLNVIVIKNFSQNLYKID